MSVHYGNNVGFTPLAYRPQLWLDASDSNSLVLDGTNVTTWKDKSGNMRNATGASSPQYVTNVQNGKPVIRCGGTSYFDVDLNFVVGGSHSAFIVLSNSTYTNIYGAAGAAAGSASIHIGFSGNTAYRINYWGHDYYPVITSAFKAGSFNVVGFSWPVGSNKKAYANGNLEQTGGQIALAPTALLNGGRILNVTSQGIMVCDLAELIFFNKELSSEYRQKLEGYLAHKWGIASFLVAGHPYISSSPQRS